METLGKMLKDARVKKGLTQEQLAAEIQSAGIKSSKSNISNYERGQSKPPYHVLHEIAAVLDVPPDELLSYTVAEKSNSNNIPIDNQQGKRPRRIKRLLSAFSQLSDEAQIKAISRVEELLLVPGYQQTLAGVLQEYICNRCRLIYALVKDAERTGTYDDEDGHNLQWRIRHMVLQHGTEQKGIHRWDFIYFKFQEPVDDYVIKHISMEITNIIAEPVYNLAFVFDDKATLSNFYICYQNQKKFIDSDMMREEISPLFLLVEKDDTGIKNITEYNPPDEY